MSVEPRSRTLSMHDVINQFDQSDEALANLSKRVPKPSQPPADLTSSQTKFWSERSSKQELLEMKQKVLDLPKMDPVESTYKNVKALVQARGKEMTQIVLNEDFSDEENINILQNCPNIAHIQLIHTKEQDRKRLADKISVLVKHELPNISRDLSTYTFSIQIAKL